MWNAELLVAGDPCRQNDGARCGMRSVLWPANPTNTIMELGVGCGALHCRWAPTRVTSLGCFAMEAGDVSEPVPETKSAEPLAHASLNADGEPTPISKQENSQIPHQAPRVRHGRGFALT